jgi:hypothetical protein
MNHLPGIVGCLFALLAGYLVVTLEMRVDRQQAALETITRDLMRAQEQLESAESTADELEELAKALQQNPPPATAGSVTSEALNAALREHALMVDEKLKLLTGRPIEIKVYDMANPVVEVTPLIPPPPGEGPGVPPAPAPAPGQGSP